MQRPSIQFMPKDRRVKQSIWLSAYAKNVASQFGEDGIISKIFDIIGMENRFCVDFGADNGITISNSFNLCYNKKWGGVLIEPSDHYDQLADLYKERDDVITIHGKVGFTNETKLDSLLNNVDFDVPKNFDFLSIDVDGNELWIWEDIKEYRPRVVCVEFNQDIANDIYFIQAKDESINQGSSLLAFTKNAKIRGYELVATTFCNAFFVDSMYFPQFNIPDNSVDAMYFCQDDNRIIMTYDGTLYTAGPCWNMWKNYKIDEEKIQQLPKEERIWNQY